MLKKKNTAMILSNKNTHFLNTSIFTHNYQNNDVNLTRNGKLSVFG